jgi:dUTP pyrophosphatase
MAAAVDLHACIEHTIHLVPGNRPQLISAGFSMHIGDPGIAAILLPRSGLGHKQGLVLGNLVGLVDADYTGPVSISAWNRESQKWGESIKIEPGMRIAQMMFVPVIRPTFVKVKEFTKDSLRGAGGFGSTGDKESLVLQAALSAGH